MAARHRQERFRILRIYESKWVLKQSSWIVESRSVVDEKWMGINSFKRGPYCYA